MRQTKHNNHNSTQEQKLAKFFNHTSTCIYFGVNRRNARTVREVPKPVFSQSRPLGHDVRTTRSGISNQFKVHGYRNHAGLGFTNCPCPMRSAIIHNAMTVCQKDFTSVRYLLTMRCWDVFKGFLSSKSRNQCAQPPTDGRSCSGDWWCARGGPSKNTCNRGNSVKKGRGPPSPSAPIF